MTEQVPESGQYAPFVKELARYFMEFLETDFHRRRVPKRAIVERNSQNLLIGVGLARYPKYCTHLWGLLDENAGTFVDLIEPGRHTRPVPEQTLQLLNERAELLEAGAILALHTAIGTAVKDASQESPDDVEVAVEHAREAVVGIIRSELVQPFLNHVEGPLSKLARNGIDVIHETETNLTEVIASQIDEVVGSVIRSAILGVEFDLSGSLEQVCNVESCRDAIRRFFSGLSVSDLAFDVQELFDNHRILDKQETYLNIGTLTFEKRTYPIFYTPLRVERSGGRALSLTADAPIYINRKAIEYVIQQFNQQTGRHGGRDLVDQRILYPGELKGQLSTTLQAIVDSLANYFGLPDTASLRARGRSNSDGLLVQMSNDLHLTIFDKSDEALINDYEDILILIDQDAPVAGSFGGVVRGFMNENPATVKTDTEEEWVALPSDEKAVFPSPVPLNAEQRKILVALQKPKCQYVAVEGPPGTGKSHTITALVCNAVLAHQSVLILSDKAEALDVVEDKITTALSQIRLPEEEFQNPILRLGKSGSNFAEVLSQASLRKIGDHYRAVKSREEQMVAKREQLTKDLKTDITDTISSLNEVRLGEIRELLELEDAAHQSEDPPDLGELFAAAEPPSLTELSDSTARLAEFTQDPAVRDLLVGDGSPSFSVPSLRQALELLATLEAFRTEKQEDLEAAQAFVAPDSAQLQVVTQVVTEYKQLTAGVFGGLFKRKKIVILEGRIQSECQLTEAADLRKKSDLYLRAAGALRQLDASTPALASVATIHQLLIADPTAQSDSSVADLIEDVNLLADFAGSYPTSAASLGIDGEDISNLGSSRLVTLENSEIQSLDRRVSLQRKLRSSFSELPVLDYASRLEGLERLKTHEMAHLLDGRVLQFAERQRNDARTLKDIIRKRKRFPRPLFGSLKEAFPCIIAGIRDYAEYIPLEPELFDLVVIDEASQVSIAQAFPALLRAKKVVVFGDRKQFSNVKSAQARGEINLEWKARLRSTFTNTVGADPTQIQRVDKFDIKTSILEFFDHVCNFDIMLRKYFRGYAEHISYSSKYFYKSELQAIRLRTQSIDDTLRFTVLEDDGLIDPIKITNSLEADFIVKQLEEMKERGDSRSVGIITPHTNQQKLIAERISGHRDREFFFEKLRIKVMTFDTCQGEERDVIFYSMVASPRSDKLWAIFVKDLAQVDLEENGQIKAQRLNVGFSRAKECMHFVLSKKPEDYRGAIGDALAHYASVLEKAPSLPTPEEVDSRSPKEAEALHWVQQTSFFQKHSGQIELHAQFPLGEALRQLDPYYQHPSYKVDFLLLYRDDDGEAAKIIIEYDGFEHHFRDREFVTDSNYGQYYTADDVERQLVMESYGYRFIRLNRFNCADEPVGFLNGELERVTEKKVPMT